MKCKKCSTSNGLHAIGNCSGCGAMISQMSDKFCAQCSQSKNACQSCGTALTPANNPAGAASGNTGGDTGDGSSAT